MQHWQAMLIQTAFFGAYFSFLCFILGGAIIPPLQGLFADATGSLQLSFLVPMLCYLFIVYYGFAGYKPKAAD